VLLVVGTAISTVCYALTIRAGLGLGPLYVAQDGLSRTLGMSIGHAVMLSGVALIGAAMVLRSWPGPGTLILPFLGGFMLDAMLPWIPDIHGWVLRGAVVIVATVVMALGGALVINAAIGVSGYDAVMLGFHRILGRPLAPIRLVMEFTIFVAGWALGGAVGVGTVVTGLLIGPGLQFWVKRFSFLDARPAPAPAQGG
jgi:uncharacterized membrane protein YczE